MTAQPTGSERVLEFLRDRRWHTLAEIEAECRVEGRSRLSDLRRQGHVLERQRNEGGFGKAKYSHRLVQTALERSLQDDELASLEGHGVGASCPSSDDCSSHAPTEEPPAAIDAGGSEFIAGSASAAPYHGDECSAADVSDPSAAELEDAGWRDLFPAESAGEPLPPPSDAQLPLLPEVVA